MVAVLEHGDGYLVLPRFFVPAGRHPEALRARRRAVRLLGRAGPHRRHSRALWSTTGWSRLTPPSWPSGSGSRRSRSTGGTRPAPRPACRRSGCRWSRSARDSPAMSPAVQGGRAADPEPAACPRRQSGDALVPQQRGDRAGSGRQHQDRPAARPRRRWTARLLWPWRSVWQLPPRPGRYTRSGRASWSSNVPQDHRRDGEGSQQMDQVRDPDPHAFSRSRRSWRSRRRTSLGQRGTLPARHPPDTDPLPRAAWSGPIGRRTAWSPTPGSRTACASPPAGTASTTRTPGSSSAAARSATGRSARAARIIGIVAPSAGAAPTSSAPASNSTPGACIARAARTS